MVFFVVIVLCTVSERLAWVGGWIRWIRFWRTGRMMSVRDWWAVIFPSSAFLVIMYDMLRFIIRDVANKGV